ncbi:hypothetical protein AMS68_005117 [Peltaster fructicola]|uniref:Uncharacterized protein n=1 Tax=Peltaster fructicola TaxID=286661 RepID=A0A6H0XYV3_9PEZI|nr:hypothetical protein AMS68_005117 [Peltaster fructicola]
MPPAVGAFYTDGQMPKTPVNDEVEIAPCEPPPPPRQTYKIKRKRVVTQPPAMDVLDGEQIIPTIEMSEAISNSPDIPSPMLELTTPTSGLLAPMPQIFRSLTPPKTPARLLTSFDSPVQEWGMINSSERRPFERTGSIGSSFSDSSLSSLGSTAFSAVSPIEDNTDPFLEEGEHIVAPFAQSASPDAKRAKTNRRAMWTPAMDEHLWMTYMAYLSDPTLTPFKMLPGTAPPLGVCHRVAAKAKRTWRDHKTVSGSISLDSIFARPQREGSPDTIRPESSKMAQLTAQSQWPRSESETRKRLRGLCKKRPSLSAYYQRILRTRSPSPFDTTMTAVGSDASSAFSSVDMKMSSSHPPAHRCSQMDLLLNSPARTCLAHDRSGRIDQQIGLGLDTRAPTLASPFDEISSRSHLLQSSAATKSLGRDFNRSAPFLDSPFEGAPTAPRSLKRRFRSDEEKPKRLPLQGIFGHTEPLTGLRNRGFSLGTNADEMATFFNPPSLQSPAYLQAPTPASSSQDHDMLDTPDLSMLGPPGSRSAPRRLAEPTPRLGSPFVEACSTSRQFNTFPRSIFPNADNPQPFQRRLQELLSQPPQPGL